MQPAQWQCCLNGLFKIPWHRARKNWGGTKVECHATENNLNIPAKHMTNHLQLKKLLMLFAVCGLFTSTAVAQKGPAIQFNTTHHDFGKVKEEGGPVIYTYTFKNIGDAPVKIDRVQPGCGCTTPDWSKEEIKPGKEGFVKATFDPNGRPGQFTKSVTVYANTEPNMSLLTFGGEVVPRTKTIEDSFPNKIGNLRLESNSIHFGLLRSNVRDTAQSLFVTNVGSAPVTIKGISGSPAYVMLDSKATDMVIKPGQRAYLPLHYSATSAKEYGIVFDQIKLVTDDVDQPEKSITLIADIKPYVPQMTPEEIAKAPRINFERKQNDFGDVKQGESVNTEFKFTNTGKQDLNILKVKTTCGCTASSPEKTVIKPGESSMIKATFHSAGKSGKQSKDITVYTNDPLNSEVTLKIMSNIILPTENK